MAGCYGLKIGKYKVNSFDQWLMVVYNGLEGLKQDVERIKIKVAYTCCLIWKTRCEVVIGGKN